MPLAASKRNHYPAALLKDRHSRSGLTKTELAHKGGDGAHNWGSLRRKADDEASGRLDAAADVNDVLSSTTAAATLPHGQTGLVLKALDADVEGTSHVNVATSPSESMSSMDSRAGDSPTTPPRPVNFGTAGGRMLSNVSDEERDSARLYREGALNKGGLDLAHIARTSYGIAQSPPDKLYMAATSPTKSNGGFNFKQ